MYENIFPNIQPSLLFELILSPFWVICHLVNQNSNAYMFEILYRGIVTMVRITTICHQLKS